MNINRRSFIAGLAALVAAPAVVRYSSLMPVSLLPADPEVLLAYYINGTANWRWASFPGDGLICPKRGALVDLMISPSDMWAPPEMVEACHIRVVRPANINKPLLVAPDIVDRGRVRATWVRPDGQLVRETGI